jgi:hypothetical protein
MTKAQKKANQLEKRDIVAVAKLKLTVRRALKEIDTLMQNVNNTFEKNRCSNANRSR